ncbi:phosphodiesterase, partial [Microbacterium lushaniae]
MHAAVRFGQHPPARRVIVHVSDTHLLAGDRPRGG